MHLLHIENIIILLIFVDMILIILDYIYLDLLFNNTNYTWILKISKFK